jgi:ABC-type tungstate transport system permease subunit
MSYTGKTIDLSKYDKYGKQLELTKVEVELADFAGWDEQVKKSEENYNIFISAVDKIDKAKNEFKKMALKTLESIERPARELSSDRDKFISRVKELGINPSELNQPKEYNKAIDRIDSLSKRARDMFNTYK